MSSISCAYCSQCVLPELGQVVALGRPISIPVERPDTHVAKPTIAQLTSEKAELEARIEELAKENADLTEQLEGAGQRNETVTALWMSDREGDVDYPVIKNRKAIRVSMTKGRKLENGKRAYGPSRKITFFDENIQKVEDILASDNRLCAVEYYEFPYRDRDGRTYKSSYYGQVINPLPKPPVVTEPSEVEQVVQPAAEPVAELVTA